MSDDLKQIRDDGRKANMNGITRNMCPYMEELYPGHREAWLRGWDEGRDMQSKPSTINTGNIPAG